MIDKLYISSLIMLFTVNRMHSMTCRLCLSILPAIFAFFLAAVFAIAITNSDSVGTLVGVGAALSSTAVILRH